MNAKALLELQVLQIRYAEAQRVRGHLELRFVVLEREELELNKKLTDAMGRPDRPDDLRAVLKEVREQWIERERLLTEYAAAVTRMATLCSQMAEALNE